MKKIFVTLTVLNSISVFASGDSAHHGGVTDLVAPLVNISILVGFLVWKLKKPLNDYFKNLSKDISTTLERVNLKSKEAEVMLNSQERKMQGLDQEIKDIFMEVENDAKNFEKVMMKDIDDKTAKLKIDAAGKIDAERRQLLEGITSEALDQVIFKTKNTIKSSSQNQESATSKMLQGL